MDDPWGSPWAVPDGATPSKDLAGSSPKADLGLAPPKPAFLTTTPTKLPSFSTKSPWDEDDDGDGFGDWASADTPAPATTNVWGGWAGEDVPDPVQRLTPTPREDTFVGRQSPIAWPGSAVKSPGSRPRSLSRKPSSLSRVSSDDPWATEQSFNNEESISHDPLQLSDQTKNPQLPETVKDESAVAAPHEDASARSEKNDDLATKGNTLGSSMPDVPAKGSPDMPSIRIQDGEQRTPHSVPVLLQGDVVNSQALPSRPSSPGSDDSHREEERIDSPITSIDEDSKTRPQMPCKTSSKVQELVEMYDGLAKPNAAEPTVDSSAERVDDRSGQSGEVTLVGEQQFEKDASGEDEDADFGDFEDPLSRRPSKQPSTFATPERILTPKPPNDEVAVSRREQGAPVLSVPSDSQEPAVLSAFQNLRDKHGLISFQPDQKDVERLFEVKTLDAIPRITSDETCLDVSDRIIQDSFTTISERKTWYRISRQGTLRKHNAGDDDNYRRITWQISDARTRTIKIVRRWMEEDSFSGRPTLGGSSGRGDAFGWNSKAEPIALDEVFRRKASTHGRSESMYQLKSPESMSSPITPAAERRASGHIHKPAQPQPRSPPAAQFGWSNDLSGAMVPVLPVVSPHASLPDHSFTPRPEPRALSTADKAQSVRPLVSRPMRAPPPLATPTQASDEAPADKDDEWGEMVISPPADQTSFPKIVDVQQHLPNMSNQLADLDFFATATPSPTLTTEPPRSLGVGLPMSSPVKTVLPPSLPNSRFKLSNDVHVGDVGPAASSDAWDLSFFERGAAVSLPDQSSRQTSHSRHIPTSAPRGIEVGSPTAMNSRALAPQHAHVDTSPSSLSDTDTKLARSIIDGLPDLSYMLR